MTPTSILCTANGLTVKCLETKDTFNAPRYVDHLVGIARIPLVVPPKSIVGVDLRPQCIDEPCPGSTEEVLLISW